MDFLSEARCFCAQVLEQSMKRCPLCLRTYDGVTVCPEDGATLLTENAGRLSLVGETLKGSYKITGLLGEGGCGSVYLAIQQPLNRQVAVKVLRQQTSSGPEAIQRFLKEARLLSQLQHPNIISVIDFGNTEEGLTYLVMEYVDGKTLKDFVPPGQGLGGEDIVRVMTQVCSAIQVAHQMNVVHRDLKPANVMVSRIPGAGDVAKVLDFGISKELSADSSLQTRTGIVMGTPGYLSPEQIRSGKSVDTRADIYALGAILYFMIAGRPPFEGESLTEILAKQLTELPEPIKTTEIRDQQAGALLPVIERAMKHDPAARYQTVDELVGDLLKVANRAGYDTIVATSAVSQLGPASTGAVGKLQSAANAHPHRGREKKTVLAGGIAALLLAGLAAIVGFVAPKTTDPGGIAVATLLERPKSTDRGVTADTITMGMTAAFSGTARELGRSMKIGLDAAFATANDKRGAINGRKLKLVALDDGYEPMQALENTRRLIEEDKVFALIGNAGTPTAEASLPAALASKTLVFGSFTGTSLLRKVPPDRYVFNYRASYKQETMALVRYLVEVRKIAPKDIAVFAQNDRFGDEGYQGVVDAMIQLYGTPKASEATLRVGYERNSSEVEPAVNKLFAERRSVKAVIAIATAPSMSRFTAAVRKRNSTLLLTGLSFVGSRALLEAFRDIGASIGKGIIVSQVVPDIESQATLVLRYREAMAKYFPNEQPGFVSLEGYIAGALFIEGLKRTGERLTTERLTDAFESMNSVDLGVGTPLTFGLSDHQASDRVWGIELDDQGGHHPIELSPNAITL